MSKEEMIEHSCYKQREWLQFKLSLAAFLVSLLMMLFGAYLVSVHILLFFSWVLVCIGFSGMIFGLGLTVATVEEL